MKSLIQSFQDTPLLVTFSQWFFAPDGNSYRAAWGIVQIYSDEATLGIKTNNKSSNWYISVGIGDKAVVVAGCQIHYAVVSKDRPNNGRIKETRCNDSKGEGFVFYRDTVIYIAE